jgi:endonuclease YncB( thermonuclease family)
MSALEYPWHGTVTNVCATPSLASDHEQMCIVYITLDDQNANVAAIRQGQIAVAMPYPDAPPLWSKIDVHLVVNKGDIDAELPDLSGS